jgi:hypothetical protein
MTSHEMYGNIQYDVWLPAYGHRTYKKNKVHEFIPLENYEIMFLDNKDTPFLLRNKNTKNIKKSKFCYYDNICINNKRINYCKTHVALASAFPNIPPKETVDHINDDPNDDRIINLQWMDRSENSRKGQVKSVREIKKNGGRKCKYVTMRKPDENDKKNRDKSVSIGLFRNVDKCARFIIDNVIVRDNKPKLKTVAAKIRRAINRPELKAYGYYYDVYETKIENEEWKYHHKFTKYQASTHGRIRNSHGTISKQEKTRNGASYNSVCIRGRRYYVHRFIWETFVGEIPEGFDIMHDDTVPKYDDGSYRNWLCDLTIGRRSENMISFHKNKHINHTITKNKFNEIIPEKNILLPDRQYPDNPLGVLMSKPPPGVQYIQPKKSGRYYCFSKNFSKAEKDKYSSTSKYKSDEEKFIQILRIYKEFCIEEKQDEKFMNLNIDDYVQYIPT